MKPRTRVILTWLYCIIGASVTGGLIGCHYSSSDLTASPTDIRKLETISGIFCESVLIDSSTIITTYKFKSKPKVNETSSLVYQKAVSTVLTGNNYEYWGFYLLENSVTKVSVCPEYGISFYIIKGEKNLDAWKKNALCSNCHEREYFLYSCSGSPQHVSFKASSSDQYYFLFANDLEPGRVSVDITFTLNRKMYSLEDSYTVCLDSFDCNVPLSVYNAESIVFYVPKDSSFDTSVTIFCHPRVYIYVILCAILPIGCGTVLTIIILLISKRKHQQRTRTSSQVFATSNSERLHGHTNESHQINISPPSYTDAPPSYEEAISSRSQ